MSQETRDPQAAGRRMLDGVGPMHDLTNLVARAIHESEHPRRTWDRDRTADQWLAVGSWIAAEKVVKALPERMIRAYF